jgi:hypothetical protein
MNSPILKKPVRWDYLLALCLFFVFAQTSCKKDDSSGNGTMRMYLTDAPGDYQAVYIDIQSVEVTGAGGPKIIPVKRPGVYDLLKFRDGLDTLLGDVELPAGTVSQIRLILGTENSVKIDGVVYPLSTPSAQQSGLKLNVRADIVAGVTYSIWIDFDASRSIVNKGNGTYSLKPVIRTFTKALTGGIKGVVSPANSVTNILAIQNTDTIGGMVADSTGKFLIGGLNAGTYKVLFKGNSPFSDKTVTGVAVTVGATTDMGTVVIL